MVLGASLVATWSVALVVRLYLPRHLGPALFGAFNFADTFAATFFIFLGLGVETYIQKVIPVRPRHASDFLGGFIAVARDPRRLRHVGDGRRDGADPPAARGAAGRLRLRRGPAPRLDRHHAGGALARVARRRGPRRIVNVASKALWGAGVAVAIATRAGLVGLAVAFLVAEAVRMAVLARLARRHLHLELRFEPAAVRAVILASLPFYMNQVANTIYAKVDVSLLTVLTNDTEVGWYGAASNLASLALLVSPLVGAVLLPLLSRAAARSRDELFAILRRVIEAVLLAVMPISLFAGLGRRRLGPAALRPRLRAGDAQPAPARADLRAHLPRDDQRHGLILLDRAWRVATISLVALFVNPALNLPLVPAALSWLGPGRRRRGRRARAPAHRGGRHGGHDAVRSAGGPSTDRAPAPSARRSLAGLAIGRDRPGRHGARPARASSRTRRRTRRSCSPRAPCASPISASLARFLLRERRRMHARRPSRRDLVVRAVAALAAAALALAALAVTGCGHSEPYFWVEQVPQTELAGLARDPLRHRRGRPAHRPRLQPGRGHDPRPRAPGRPHRRPARRRDRGGRAPARGSREGDRGQAQALRRRAGGLRLGRRSAPVHVAVIGEVAQPGVYPLESARRRRRRARRRRRHDRVRRPRRASSWCAGGLRRPPLRIRFSYAQLARREPPRDGVHARPGRRGDGRMSLLLPRSSSRRPWPARSTSPTGARSGSAIRTRPSAARSTWRRRPSVAIALRARIWPIDARLRSAVHAPPGRSHAAARGPAPRPPRAPLPLPPRRARGPRRRRLRRPRASTSLAPPASAGAAAGAAAAPAAPRGEHPRVRHGARALTLRVAPSPRWTLTTRVEYAVGGRRGRGGARV